MHVREGCPRMVIRLGAYIKKEGGSRREESCFVRRGVAERLGLAQSFLPKGHRLLLRCGYRPLALQKKRYDWMHAMLGKQHPEWTVKMLKEETGKRVAPPDIVPPHTTGGAVDLSIIGPDGRQLDMGTRLGRFTEKTPTAARGISAEAKRNRKMLIRTMTEAGFVNYPTEWWHWSYGDRYWAAALKKGYSIYGGR